MDNKRQLKTVALTQEVWEKLFHLKEPTDTYNDVIRKLLRK